MNKIRIAIITVILFVAGAAYGQWQKIGKEQLPTNLGDTSADSLATDEVQATDATGLSIKDDEGNLGGFVEDGGEVGIGTNAPETVLNVEGVSTLGMIAKFESDVASLQTYHRVAIDGPVDEDTQVSFMDDGSTKWSIGNDGGSDTFVVRKGAGAFGTNDYFSVDSSGNVFLMGDTGGRIAFETVSNEFRFGSSNVLQIDADDGNMNSSGALDFAGSGEFGSASEQLVLYQPAADYQSTDLVTYLETEDTVHPTTASVQVHVSLPCPWSAPGSRLASVKFVFHVGDDSDTVNFAVKRQTSAAPGTTTDIAAFGGSDYGRVSDLVHIDGSYYSKTGTADYTLASNEKVWAVVRLYSDSTANSCRLVGIEWTYDQRTY